MAKKTTKGTRVPEDHYDGELKGNKPHGYGTYIFANGEKYIGYWKNAERSGEGTYTYPDGEEYVGEWANDCRHGQGTYTFADGEKYVGEWKNGEKSGFGSFTYADGQTYRGQWKDDEKYDPKALAQAKSPSPSTSGKTAIPIKNQQTDSREDCTKKDLENWIRLQEEIRENRDLEKERSGFGAVKPYLYIFGLLTLATFLSGDIDLLGSVLVIIIILLVIGAFIGAGWIFIFIREPIKSGYKSLPETAQNRNRSYVNIFSRSGFVNFTCSAFFGRLDL